MNEETDLKIGGYDEPYRKPATKLPEAAASTEVDNVWQGKNIWVEIPVSESNMPTTVGRRYHCFDMEGKPTLFHYTGSPVSKITFKEQIKSWLDKVDNQNIQ